MRMAALQLVVLRLINQPADFKLFVIIPMFLVLEVMTEPDRLLSQEEYHPIITYGAMVRLPLPEQICQQDSAV
jgi:hypothetical protein